MYEVPYQPTGHTIYHDSLRKVHSVGDGQDHQACMASRWPVKQVVHYILLPGPQQVQLGKEATTYHKTIQHQETKQHVLKLTSSNIPISPTGKKDQLTKQPQRSSSFLCEKVLSHMVIPHLQVARWPPSWGRGYWSVFPVERQHGQLWLSGQSVSGDTIRWRWKSLE